jgi:hypothetical protein
MSFFYDLNKKLDSIRATPEVTHQQLNERDLGKHNNATTGFKALAAKTNDKIAGAQLAKMREKGQVEEDSVPPAAKASASKRSSSKPSDSDYRIVVGKDTGPPPKKTDDNRLYKDSVPVDEPVDARFRDKKTTNEGGVVDPVGEIRPGQRTPARPSYKPEVKRITPLPKPSQATDDEIDESALQAAFGRKKYTEPGMIELQRLGREGASEKKMQATRDKYDQYDESMGQADEGNAFSGAVVKAKRDGIQPGEKIRVGGNSYPVKEAGRPMTPKQKSFAKLAPPADKITFADKIAGAKKEVDEMLGNVAADAMKKAVGGGRGRNAEMDEASDWSQLHKPFNAGHFDDTPTSRKSNTSGRVDTSKTGSTVHYAGKNYSGAGHDVGAETGSANSDGPRGRGRPKGSQRAIGAKINRGTSKLMTREGNQDPADQGEYDREGEMSRNEIHTMMRNAKQLEKMLGNDDDLPEWVQKKLSLASDYMQTIADYLASEKETDAEDQTGRRVEVELAEKKAKPTKKSSGNDGNLANNAKPYDKVTRGDVIAGRLGKDEMGGKSTTSKTPAKKEKEVEESTTAGSVATAPTSGKAGGDYGFGGGVYESINRAVETQINESMNISMNMSTDEHGGPRQSLTITATDEDASQLAQLLKMAGMGGGDDMSHGAESDGGEVCSGCGMADCGCGDMEQMYEAAPPGMGAAFRGAGELVKSMRNRLGTPAEKAASNAASDAYMAANGEANFRKLLDKLESDPAKYKYTGSPKTTRLPYMGPPKDIEDPTASAFKSYFEPGTATHTNRIPTIDKPPQMRRSTDRPAFDQSVRQLMVKDPFDPLVDESYGDNVTDMNSPDYPTNTEQAENNFGYSGGLNKEKRDVAGNGQSTVPVTAVREQDDDFQESIQRMREIAGIKEAGVLADPRDVMRQVAPPRMVDMLPKTFPGASANKPSSYKNTFLDPAQKAQQKMARQNESIFTDTANLWKSYKG